MLLVSVLLVGAIALNREPVIVDDLDAGLTRHDQVGAKQGLVVLARV